MVDLLLGSSPLTVEQRSYVHTIRKSGEKLLAVLSNILDSCQLDSIRATTAGNTTDSCQMDSSVAATAGSPFSLHEMVQRALGLASGAALSLGASRRVTSHIAFGVPDAVEGDSQGMFHLLCCLISKALSFRCVGRGRLAALS